MPITRFTNCHLCDNGLLYRNTDLYIDTGSGKIVEPVSGSQVAETVDLQGHILAPGFLDIQNNGVYGVNFLALNADSSAADIAEFSRFYADAMAKYLKTGVTSICPTVTSNFPEVYEKVLPLYREQRLRHQTDSLGAHLEGPFISLKKKGCHPIETFVDAHEGDKLLFDVYGEHNLLENVRIVTAAPEIPGVLDIIPAMKAKNITFAVGHTAADYKTGLRAIEAGATMITHLYNAMPQPHHRDVGVVGLITLPIADGTSQSPYFGLICDGVHVDPAMATMAYRANPNKCILVTDAMHLIGLPDGTYKWDSQSITKKGPILYLKGTTTLAGAATTLGQCVRNLMKWSGLSLAEAVKTVTNNPADLINAQASKGYLNVGCDADLVVMDAHGFLVSVYKLGVHVKPVDENQPARLMAAL